MRLYVCKSPHVLSWNVSKCIYNIGKKKKSDLFQIYGTLVGRVQILLKGIRFFTDV